MNIMQLMQHAGLNAIKPEAIVDPARLEDEAATNYRPNRRERRQMAKYRGGKRWDKMLAQHYGIPKMFIQHARRYGGSTEMILSELLQQGAIKYREIPEAQ